jgi:AcrR family transcriptional regulator
MSRPLRAPRADNRMPQLLDEAARLFGAQGFHGTSIRDIVSALDMLPGSIYYHFATKDFLLLAVYAEGVRRISQRVEAAVKTKSDPWGRLEAACVAHLEAVLDESGYAQVVIRVRPADVPSVATRLNEMRDGYERLFVELVEALPVALGIDRRGLRLLLLGALNWTQTWYRPGRHTPRAIAKYFVKLLREPVGAQ